MRFMPSEDDAKVLLQEMKDAAINDFDMPEGKERNKGFDVTGRQSASQFRISMYRGMVDFEKHSINAMLKEGNVVLMRLCVGAGRRHSNHDGTIVDGSHLHIYKEGYGDHYAYPVDIQSPDFINDTLLLLGRFNVVSKPHLHDGMMP
ncbi:hypothetical protein BBOMB_1579 [Bifidobacterium bombi DSM 19703]|uniref:Prophage protein n=2 Tax=Bifidobacterium bombi TaxID=471511 RepID=A0A086BND7_9BIFI|nr:hypothetical protein BBOMB_1579 [Bifidobacterium bombi DSM 19703]